MENMVTITLVYRNGKSEVVTTSNRDYYLEVEPRVRSGVGIVRINGRKYDLTSVKNVQVAFEELLVA